MSGNVNRRRVLVAATAAACAQPSLLFAQVSPVPRFSTAPIGPGAAGWQHQTLPKVPRANRFDIVDEDARRVLRVRSSASASSWLARLPADMPLQAVLQWQWKVSRALAGSNVATKPGDDYAARLYVLFDLPSDRLSFADRLKLQAARTLSGTEVPAAALCYVWGTAQPAGTAAWNPYTDRVRMVVVDSGDAFAGHWRPVRRDLKRDWEASFGGAMPAIAAIAVGADTDNTGESVDAWFGDVSLSQAP